MTQASRRAVVDASVALKWQLDDEDHVDRALSLRDDYLIEESIVLIAPTLFPYELANGVWAAAKRERLSMKVARDALRNLVDCEVETREPDLEKVLEIALKHRVAAYDAAYVALAKSLGVDLWTADRPLYNSVRKTYPTVRWIGDYPLPT